MDDYLYEALGIAKYVQKSLNVKFNLKVFLDVLTLTIRKMELNGQRRDYFQILFANELKDHAMRSEINASWRDTKWVEVTA